MEAVRDLDGLRGALPGAFRIRTRPIARDNLYARMRPEPLRYRRGCPIWQQGDGLATFQVHEDRAIRVAFPQCPIIYAQDPGCGQVRRQMAAAGTRAAATMERGAGTQSGWPSLRHDQRS